MTLYKRKDSNNFYMDFIVQGQRVNRSTGTGKRDLAAKIEKAEKVAALEMMFMPPEQSGVSLANYIEEVYADKWRSQASGEQTYDRLQLCLHILGNVNIKTIDRRMIKGLRQQLSHDRKDATVNRYLAHLKTLLNEARKDGLIDTVPHFDMKPEPKTRDIFYTISPEVEGQLVNWCRKCTIKRSIIPDMADFIEVGLDTGMRLGELIGLRLSENVNFETSRITLYADQVKTNNHRVIPMTHRVVDVLKRREKTYGDRPFPYLKTSVCHTWNKIKKQSKVGGETTPHSLRHTFATRLLSRNGNLKHVQKLLGHGSIKTTERYAHVITNDLEDTIRLLHTP